MCSHDSLNSCFSLLSGLQLRGEVLRTLLSRPCRFASLRRKVMPWESNPQFFTKAEATKGAPSVFRKSTEIVFAHFQKWRPRAHQKLEILPHERTRQELLNRETSFLPPWFLTVPFTRIDFKLCQISLCILPGVFLGCVEGVCGVQQAMAQVKQHSEQHSQNLHLISSRWAPCWPGRMV